MVKDISAGLESTVFRFLYGLERFPGDAPGELALMLIEQADVSTERKLWRTDGTAAGTFSVNPPGVRFTDKLAASGEVWWLRAVDEALLAPSLWVSDGTLAGTRRVAEALELQANGRPAFHDGLGLYFFTASPYTFDSGDPDYEPWVSDGTPAGTHRLADLVPGASSFAQGYTVLGDLVYFLAREPVADAFALWESDGTSEGTRVAALPPSGVGFDSLVAVGDDLYFLGFDFGEQSLWRVDPATGASTRVADFGLRADGDLGLRLAAALGDGRSLWAVETRQTSASLWASDGTVAGTREILSLTHGSALAFGPVVPHGGGRYFLADDGAAGFGVWRTDGTVGGTRRVFDGCSGPCGQIASDPFEIDGRLYVTVFSRGQGTWLWDIGGPGAPEPVYQYCGGTCIAYDLPIDLGGWRLFMAGDIDDAEGTTFQYWGTDLTGAGTRRLTDLPLGVRGGPPRIQVLRDAYLFTHHHPDHGTELWSVPFDRSTGEAPPPPGDWLSSPAVPGFSFKVRFSTPSGALAGTLEDECIAETVCVSGALPGRSEVFARVVGPKPNGFLWPTLVKFSTSTVETWARQDATGLVRRYVLEGARPGLDELPGLFDRTGFVPAVTAVRSSPAGESVQVPPPATVFTSEHFPDFRFRVRISTGGQVQEVRKESACIAETLCLSGAVPGRSEIFLRLVGPKPNGRLWPTIVKFTTSTAEVWMEQISTGDSTHYILEGAAPGKDDLTGLFDREGFQP